MVGHKVEDFCGCISCGVFTSGSHKNSIFLVGPKVEDLCSLRIVLHSHLGPTKKWWGTKLKITYVLCKSCDMYSVGPHKKCWCPKLKIHYTLCKSCQEYSHLGLKTKNYHFWWFPKLKTKYITLFYTKVFKPGTYKKNHNCWWGTKLKMLKINGLLKSIHIWCRKSNYNFW